MRRTIAQLRDHAKPLTRSVKLLARRVAVKLTGNAGVWNVLGHDAGDAGADVDEAQDYQGRPGFFSRTRAGKGEAIAIQVGNFTFLVGGRDGGYQVELLDDETAMANSTLALVKITKDGDVIVRAKAGREVLVDDGSGAVSLATKADVEAIKTAIAGAAVAAGDGGATLKTNIVAALSAPANPTWPVGTTVLKGK